MRKVCRVRQGVIRVVLNATDCLCPPSSSRGRSSTKWQPTSSQESPPTSSTGYVMRLASSAMPTRAPSTIAVSRRASARQSVVDAVPHSIAEMRLASSCRNRSVNEVICHGIPDGRPLQEGDIVNLDVSLCACILACHWRLSDLRFLSPWRISRRFERHLPRWQGRPSVCRSYCGHKRESRCINGYLQAWGAFPVSQTEYSSSPAMIAHTMACLQ